MNEGSTTKYVCMLTPVDTWFFRDGRPYNMYEKTQTDVGSLFPPFAPTVVGAIRAGIARALGWDGHGPWSDELKNKLGDGEDLKSLRFRGPFIARKVNGEIKPIFPAPLHLFADTKHEKFTRVSPMRKVQCDLGNIMLPELDNEYSKMDMKPLSNLYLTKESLEKVLQGKELKQLNPIKKEQLWEMEYRVGIERDAKSKTTKDRALYSSYHVRLAKGVGLAVMIEGIDEISKLESTLPFGGEGRLAYAEVTKLDKEERMFPNAPELLHVDGKIRFTVTHLTHAYLGGNLPGYGADLPGIKGAKIISACLGKPVRIGGWDSIKARPLPLRAYLPAGSTWFCEANGNDEVMASNGKNIGEKSEYGFGQIAIGKW